MSRMQAEHKRVENIAGGTIPTITWRNYLCQLCNLAYNSRWRHPLKTFNHLASLLFACLSVV